MVTDINPAASATNGQGSRRHVDIAAVNGRLFFQADDGSHGSQPWTSPGKAAETRWSRTSTDRHRLGTDRIHRPGGVTFFEADDGVHGDELWMTDGTAAGTHLSRTSTRAQRLVPTIRSSIRRQVHLQRQRRRPRYGGLDQRRDRRRHVPAQGHQPGRRRLRTRFRLHRIERSDLRRQRRRQRQRALEDRRDRRRHHPAQGHRPRPGLLLRRELLPRPQSSYPTDLSPSMGGVSSSRPTTGDGTSSGRPTGPRPAPHL